MSAGTDEPPARRPAPGSGATVSTAHLKLVGPPAPAGAGSGLRQGLTETGRTLADTARGFSEHNVLRLAAAMAYYAVFSLAPLLVLVVTVASWLFDAAQTREFLIAQIAEVAGRGTADSVAAMMQSRSWRRNSLLASLMAIGAVLLGASAMMAELKRALDEIAGPPARPLPRPAWYTLVAVRVRGLSMILVVALLLLASMVLSAAVSAFGTWWSSRLPVWVWLLEGLNNLVSLALATALFASVFRWFPDRRMDTRACLAGALAAAVLFTVGKTLIGLYIGAAGVADAFGAAGSLAVIMTWVYYTTLIVLTGAELARAIDAHRGGGRRAAPAVSPPEPGAG